MLDSLGLRQFPVKRSCDSSHFFFQPSCLLRHSSIRTRGCEISLGASRSGHLIIVLFVTFSGGSGRRHLSHSPKLGDHVRRLGANSYAVLGYRPLAIAQRFVHVSNSPTTGEGVPTVCAPRTCLEQCEHWDALRAPAEVTESSKKATKKQCANSTNFNTHQVVPLHQVFTADEASVAWDRI